MHNLLSYGNLTYLHLFWFWLFIKGQTGCFRLIECLPSGTFWPSDDRISMTSAQIDKNDKKGKCKSSPTLCSLHAFAHIRPYHGVLLSPGKVCKLTFNPESLLIQKQLSNSTICKFQIFKMLFKTTDPMIILNPILIARRSFCPLC